MASAVVKWLLESFSILGAVFLLICFCLVVLFLAFGAYYGFANVFPAVPVETPGILGRIIENL